MADTKLADLTSGTAEGTDIVYAVKDPSGTPVDRKVTFSSVKDYITAAANLFTTAQTISPLTDVTALTARGGPSGTTNVLQLQDSSNNVLAAFDKDGKLTLGRGSALTGQIKFSNATNNNLITLQAGTSSGNVTYTLPTADGTNGQVLQTNGSGTLSWKTDATNSPAGSDTQIQFNNSGSFGADSTLTFNTTTKHLGAQRFGLSGNFSAAAWTTNGIRYVNTAATITDTTSSGTVATAYTNLFGGNTIAASNSTTFTDYYNTFIAAPVQGTNVTMTNRWALGLGGAAQIAAGTYTANQPALDISQTWNNSGVTFTGLKYNVTDTASNAASLLMDLQVEGVTRASISKTGVLSLRLSTTAATVAASSGGVLLLNSSSVNDVYCYGQFRAINGIAFSPADLFLTRRGTANLRLGAADAAAPVAQTLSVQSVVAGTTDTAGTNFTITGSQSTGTGAAGNILFQTSSSAASTATSQNALATVMTIGPNTLTGSQATSLLNLAQTWNTTGTPTALLLNVTDTASNASSLLMDLQVGGSSKFSVRKNGFLILSNDADVFIDTAGRPKLRFTSSNSIGVEGGIGFISNTRFGLSNAFVTNYDVSLTRRGAANLRLGDADAASPVAQTLSVQSVVAGTSNTAGTNFTITGSQGTGTGAGGSLIFQVAPAGSSGTAQNALTTALTINSSRNLVLNDGTTIVNVAPNAVNQIGIHAGGIIDINRGGGNASLLRLYADTKLGISLNSGSSSGSAPFVAYADPTVGTNDLFILRKGAANLQLGNVDAASPVAQTLSVQGGTGTDTAGKDFTITGSTSTGTGAGGNLVKSTAFSAKSTGSSTNTLVAREIIVAKGKVLTDATATSLFEIALPTLAMCGGMITATTVCTDGTDMQSISETITFSAVNKGGVYTTDIDVGTNSSAISGGTLANTWTVLTGTNKITIQLSSDTSLTPSANSFLVYYQIRNNSEQAVTIV